MPNDGSRLVLIADENASIRDALGKILRLRGFDVIAAATVEDALEAMALHQPAAAIVELKLGGGSGRDVVVSMPSRVPVIIFTSEPGESSHLERLRPRTTLVLKPYSLVMLIEILEQMLARTEDPS
jgi:DNA-binding response OmpR family regulator